jgi:hypothetical protein
MIALRGCENQCRYEKGLVGILRGDRIAPTNRFEWQIGMVRVEQHDVRTVV